MDAAAAVKARSGAGRLLLTLSFCFATLVLSFVLLLGLWLIRASFQASAGPGTPTGGGNLLRGGAFLALAGGGVLVVLALLLVQPKEAAPQLVSPWETGIVLRPAVSRWSVFSNRLAIVLFLYMMLGLFWIFWGWTLGAEAPSHPGTIPVAAALALLAIGGLLPIRDAWYAFRGLSDPVPFLTLGRESLPLGSSVPIEWRFTGRVERLGDLHVRLEGCEVAIRVGRALPGKRSETAYVSTFARHDVFRSKVPAASGSAIVQTPAVTVPSLTTAHNRICWTLRVVAATGRPPGIDEEFPVEVVPPDDAEGTA